VLLVGLSLPSLSFCAPDPWQPPPTPAGFVQYDCRQLTQEECNQLYSGAVDHIVAEGEKALSPAGVAPGGPVPESAPDSAPAPAPAGVPPGGPGQGLQGMVLSMVLLYIASPVIAVVVTCVYKAKVTDTRPRFEEVVNRPAQSEYNDFEKGLCDCWSEFPICIMLCFCPTTRLADTLASANIMQFWVVIVLAIFVLPLMTSVCCWLGFTLGVQTNSTVIMYIVPWLPWLLCAAIFAKFRGDLREKLGMSGEGNFGKDCLFHLFCTPCAWGQEALELDQRTGVETKMCAIEKKEPVGDLVGLMG